jgi:hypothetical protein
LESKPGPNSNFGQKQCFPPNYILQGWP